MMMMTTCQCDTCGAEFELTGEINPSEVVLCDSCEIEFRAATGIDVLDMQVCEAREIAELAEMDRARELDFFFGLFDAVDNTEAA
jgi:hypothetical protein